MDDDRPKAVSSVHYHELETGSSLHEFEIVSTLGSGGFGITYLALDTFLQEKVAIKEYFPGDLAVRTSDTTVKAKTAKDQQTFSDGLKAFLQEARLLARFRHKNIVQVRRFFEFHGTGYIVLDYEHGQTLSKRLEAGALDEKELRNVISGILDGLSQVHERAILHRDLKPSNVILRSIDGSPALIDFGAARDFGSRSTKTMTTLGTPGYSPPEQQGAGGQQGPWSDLYALGATIYRAVTGRAPMVSVGRLRTDTLVPATVAAKGKYSAQLLEVTDWMLRIPEAERPISVDAVREALAAEIDLSGRGAFRAVSQATVDAIADKFEQDTSTPDQISPPLERSSPLADAAEKTGTLPTPAAPHRRSRVLGVLALTLAIVGGGLLYHFFDKPASRDPEPSIRPDFITMLRQTPDEVAALQSFLATCGADCPADVADQARGRISKLERDAARLTELDSALASTPDDATELQKFLDRCGEDCPPRIAIEAGRRLDIVRKEALRRAELRANLAEIGDDVPLLQRFLEACGSNCPTDIATQTRQRIDAINKVVARRGELTKILSETSDDVPALRQFLSDCGPDCPAEILQQAQKRIDKLNDIAARRAELSAALARLSGDRSALEAFLQSCEPDCPKDIAEQAHRRIEQIDTEAARQSELNGLLARTAEDPAALQMFLDKCGADCPASIQARARERLDAINEKKANYSRLADRLALTSNDLDALLQFLNQCGPDCPTDLSENAKAKIRALTSAAPSPPPVIVAPTPPQPKPERRLEAPKRSERAQTPPKPRRQVDPPARRGKCFNFNGATFCE